MKFLRWRDVKAYDSPRPKMGHLVVVAGLALKFEEEELEKKKKSPVASPERKFTNPQRSSRKRCSKGSCSDPDFMTNQKKSKSSKEKPKAGTMRSEEEEVDVDVDVATAVPNPPLDMPEEFKDRIREVNGTEAIMVIQKCLTATDLRQDHGRLSIPFGKINRGFLREKESEVLAKQETLEVPFMEPSQTVNKMAFRQWDMPKKSGKTSSMYVIRTHWNDVAKANALHKNDVVQIWSFRVGAEQQLRLALVVVSRAPG